MVHDECWRFVEPEVDVSYEAPKWLRLFFSSRMTADQLAQVRDSKRASAASAWTGACKWRLGVEVVSVLRRGRNDFDAERGRSDGSR